MFHALPLQLRQLRQLRQLCAGLQSKEPPIPHFIYFFPEIGGIDLDGAGDFESLREEANALLA